MKTKLTLLFSLVLFLSFNAQIPYATQQPKWYFPIYAEDATGKKDTIYFACEPGISNTPDSAVNYGEIWHPGVTDFSLATAFWVDPVDSVKKVSVQDSVNGNYLSYILTLSNVVLPVTFRWDASILRSDSLYFPNQAPLPKAQINMWFPVGNYWIEDPNVSCNISFPVVISDTINSTCSCYAKDSLTILDPFGNTSPQSFYLNFEVVPWTGTYVSIKEYKTTKFSVVPNPFTDEIRITNNNLISNFFVSEVVVINELGNELIRTNPNSTIKLSHLNNGIYFLKILNERGTVLETKKIIKN